MSDICKAKFLECMIGMCRHTSVIECEIADFLLEECGKSAVWKYMEDAFIHEIGDVGHRY